MSILSIPADLLIKKVAEKLKLKIAKPAWADYVKTSCSKERAPDNRDWIYVRMGSILYRLYVDGPQGVGSLRTYYGSKKRRGRARPHHRRASGKVIRFCLQALEKEGLVEKAKPKGRKISPKGISFLEKVVKEAKSGTKAEESNNSNLDKNSTRRDINLAGEG
ncbi:MAG: 30S ribosomal protein S19e [Candidatus Diapherotrites archaeon]|nr:30S ribosomal protein S19e [Candidatus Diapherotrites archaeon]